MPIAPSAMAFGRTEVNRVEASLFPPSTAFVSHTTACFKSRATPMPTEWAAPMLYCASASPMLAAILYQVIALSMFFVSPKPPVEYRFPMMFNAGAKMSPLRHDLSIHLTAFL